MHSYKKALLFKKSDKFERNCIERQRSPKRRGIPMIQVSFKQLSQNHAKIEIQQGGTWTKTTSTFPFQKKKERKRKTHSTFFDRKKI